MVLLGSHPPGSRDLSRGLPKPFTPTVDVYAIRWHRVQLNHGHQVTLTLTKFDKGDVERERAIN